MHTIITKLIDQADEMSLTTATGNGTAIVETSVGAIRVYRENDVNCINMKRLKTRTSYKINGKAISFEKLEKILGGV